MKIAIIGTSWPFRGGLAAFNERLARELQKEGHQVHMHTFSLQYPSFLFPGKTQYSSKPAPSDLHITQSINSVNPLNWKREGKRIRKEQYDLTIFCYWMSFMAPCFGTIAKVIGNKSKRIALVHNMIPHEKSILDRLFPPYFVNNMDGFIALSQSVIDDINSLDKGNKPKAFSPHPIYDHFGETLPREQALDLLGLNHKYRYILFFGLIREYKGLDLLIEAFADERLKELQLKLLIAGEFYDAPETYLDLIEEKELNDHVIIADDYIPDEEVKQWFSAADIVVQPYRRATQSGISQIAYHFEKPMIVSNVGGLPEIVPHGKAGYVVKPKAKDIADALVDFFTHQKAEVFIKGLKHEKLKYEWGEMTKNILHLASNIK